MRVGKYLESELSDISRHPHPRLPGGRLKNRKYKKSAFGGKKSPAHAGTKEIVNRIAVSSGNSEPKVTGAALCGAER